MLFLVAVIDTSTLYVLHHFINFVDPILDRKKIAQIKNLLRRERRFRDLLLFTVGINTALQVSDLLRLRIGHFMDDRQAIRKPFQIKEQKRGKHHEVSINASIWETFEEYLARLQGVDMALMMTMPVLITPNAIWALPMINCRLLWSV